MHAFGLFFCVIFVMILLQLYNFAARKTHIQFACLFLFLLAGVLLIIQVPSNPTYGLVVIAIGTAKAIYLYLTKIRNR